MGPKTGKATGSKPVRKSRDAIAEGLGKEVARRRKQRQLKASELARLVGVSPSLISQIERGYSQPSVSTLFALSQALDVPVDTFFAGGDSADEAETETPIHPQVARDSTVAPEGPPRPLRVDGNHVPPLVRYGDRGKINIEGGVRWERLIPDANPEVDFLELVYEPGAESNKDLYRHPGSEMVLVLEGRFEITVGFETYELAVGDSIHFSSTIPHRYVNPSGVEMARAVTVIVRD